MPLEAVSSFVVASAKGPPASVGASLRATTATRQETELLAFTPSVATKATVRVAVAGASEEFRYVMARSVACHSASVAVAPAEVSVSTPVGAS